MRLMTFYIQVNLLMLKVYPFGPSMLSRLAENKTYFVLVHELPRRDLLLALSHGKSVETI